MKVEKFVLGMIATNCYLIMNEKTKEAVIVDPATCPDYVVSHIKREGYTLSAILLTHGHFDHAMGVEEWLKAWTVPVYAFEQEKEILEDEKLNLATMFGNHFTFLDAHYLSDGHTVEAAGFVFKCIHTPGHTVGGCCYYVENEHVLFSGDTLFHGTVGRSDFYTGSEKKLKESIREKLLCLPDETIVYPGHQSATTIGGENIVWGRDKV